MATIVYLDAEDEITSAASRIRRAADHRVALVIPLGSRVATSRINFKLLAREAMANGRRLDIVAPDASARALAASAGLPVFASVAEYEDALDGPSPEDGRAVVDAPAVDGPPAVAVRQPTGPATVAAPGRRGAAGARGPAGGPGPHDAGRTPDDAGTAREAELDEIVRRGREVPIAKPRRRGLRAGVLMGVLVLVLGLGAAAVAAFLLLPSAEITITPRIEPVGPVELVVTADPEVTAVDEDALVIPAQTVEIPVEVAGEFTATGRRVETTPATGGVRWRNCDPSASYSIPDGTIVRTASGIEFAIDEAVFLPVAQITGSGAVQTIRCQTSEVAVTAAKPGPDGNVDTGQIRVVPARYDRNLVTVTNPAPTAGGTREEFTRISRKDVDAAVAALTEDLQPQFEAQLEAPAGVPAQATVFAGTARLGDAAPTVDPQSLVNQEVDTFELGLTATGTVLAVDPSPVQAIAEAALAKAVSPGYDLVPDSARVQVGEGSANGNRIEFQVGGVARQVRPVDGEALRRQVLGLPADQARALLEPFGEIELVLWPDMVTTVPTLEQRVTLAVLEAVDTAPDVEPGPPTTPAAPSPGGSPGGGDPSQPVPSG